MSIILFFALLIIIATVNQIIKYVMYGNMVTIYIEGESQFIEEFFYGKSRTFTFDKTKTIRDLKDKIKPPQPKCNFHLRTSMLGCNLRNDVSIGIFEKNGKVKLFIYIPC